MKAEELRIGNYLYCKYLDEIITVLEIKSYGIIGKSNKTLSKKWLDFIDLSPIPIDQNWLNNFGFKENKNKLFLSPYEYSLHDECFTRMCYDFVEDKSFIINSNAYDGFFIDCLYVHQLQNIYFVLTGQELNFIRK
jgi:hypothetical protein